MKKVYILIAILLTFNSCRGQTGKNSSDLVRQPAVAGQFYPEDSVILTKQLKLFLENAKPPEINNIIALIVPHAGYIYSGQIDADAYNQVKGNQYDLIIILGTNHTTAGFTGISVYPKGAFATPIGELEIDDRVAETLLNKDQDVKADLSVHKKEHSIEVQTPFIKYLFPSVKILPIIVGEPDIAMCARFGEALGEIVKDKKVLIIASSDLSHYPKFDDAVKTDNNTLKIIAGLTPAEIVTAFQDQMDKNIPQLVTCACGEAPIIAAIDLAKELGAGSASIISYSNSGYNPAGNIDRVVGYGAITVSKGNISHITDIDSVITNNSYVLTALDKRSLLKYARNVLDQYFMAQIVPLPRNLNDMLKIKRGVFVTLKKNGELRGCIGHMIEDIPLCTNVGTMALQAAFNDTRFSPLSQEELSQIEIEISVLTPLSKVKDADEIVLGRDGVVIKKGRNQAVFLPQVATEMGWSKEEFLDQLCYKAGLNKDDWKNAELFTFQADVFSENQFR